MKPYRNQKLRDFAKDAPHCFGCRSHNTEGEMLVLAHSNELKDGKGTGIKAHDIPCYLDIDCHNVVDGRSEIHLTAEERNYLRLLATYDSILWLLETGRLVVGNPPYKD